MGALQTLVDESEQAEERAGAALVGAVVACQIAGAAYREEAARLEEAERAIATASDLLGQLVGRVATACHPAAAGNGSGVQTLSGWVSLSSRTPPAALQYLAVIEADLTARRAGARAKFAELRAPARDLRRAIRALERIAATPTPKET